MKKIILAIALSTLGLTHLLAQGYFYEIEPNDAAATSNAVNINDTIVESISPGTDVDYFQVTIPLNGTLTVTSSTLPATQTLHLNVYDSALVLIGTVSSAGSGLAFTHSFAVQTGKVYLKINDINNVTSTATFGVLLTFTAVTTGLWTETSTSHAPVSVYPNPFSAQLTFSLADNMQSTVSLYNFLGQQVLQQTFTNLTTINTELLADGIYFYELRSDKGTLKTGKVVKE